MNTQTITWTALPDGVITIRDATRLRLSVFVSPRLESGDKNAPLSLFPDFLDWPEALFPTGDRREVIFRVQIGNNNPIQATRLGTKPRSDLWRALFTDSTLLQPYEFRNFKDMPIQSYPVKNIQSFIRQQYVNLATASGENFPLADALIKDPGAPFRSLAFSLRENNDVQLTAEISDELRRYKYNPSGSASAEGELAKSFLQAKLFHKPFTDKRVEIKPPIIDFHRMVSILGDYPYLLRRLGLVHDLEIPVPIRTPAENTVQVLVTWMPKDNTVATFNIPGEDRKFATRCRVGSDAFYALPRAVNPEIFDRMLPFEDPRRYEVLRIDPDGAAIKTLDFAGNLGIARSLRKTDDTPEFSSVPSMRSAGFSIARVDRAEQTHKAFIRQDALNQGLYGDEGTLLDAEDITRGYAIDVWDSVTRKWHSICRRIGSYEFSRPVPSIFEKAEDEGCITQSLTSAADDSTDVLRQGESLFRWWGWSLAAPQPGKTMNADGKPEYTGNEIDPDFKLNVNFKPPSGSLPRLRYGLTYKLRARAVDLTGNCLSTADKALQGDLHATPPLVYGRFEPVPHPVVVMRARRTEGESVERLVIRSNYDKPVEAPTERHIVPPKTSQTMAEDHALFDDVNSGKVDGEAWKLIVERENGIITGTPDPDNQGQPYVDDDKLILPYLPDYLSKAAVFRGLPGTTGPFPVEFGYESAAKWPDALPFRLVMTEGEMPKVTFHEGPRVLEVLVPKADMVNIRMSSGMLKDDVMLMGLIQWIIESGQNETAAVALAVEGRHWMLTPYELLTLVHAVRQPLRTPEFDQVHLSRQLGQTYVTLEDRVLRLSRKSTVKLDIEANWSETIDPLGEPGPRVITPQARPFEFPVPLAPKPDEEERLYVHGRHEFGDTKYRSVTYHAIATTRFAEYFTERDKNILLSGTDSFVLSADGIVEGSEAVHRADGTESYKPFDENAKSGDYIVDYGNGSIRRSGNSSSIPENVALEVSYIAPPITRIMTQPRTLDALNSARPAAPRVLYIVPTFAWQYGLSGKDNRTIESRRTGNSIRIYMERPWFTSGDGELLGVILWPGPSSISISKDPTHEKIRPFVTQWGIDPLFQSAPITALPTLAAFKSSTPARQATGLVLEEVPDVNLKVNVAGHTVAYDSDRRLWYCDMVIDAGKTYYPFIRLALARYQPKSLYGAITGPDTITDPGRDNIHLSRVVLADFIQLAPDRFASITRDAANVRLRQVSVTGRSYQILAGQTGPSSIEITLEKPRTGVDPSLAGELAWEPVEFAATAKIVLAHTTDKDGITTWVGNTTLPDATGIYRLLIKEFEQYSVPGLVPINQRRLVYADAVVLRP